MKNSFLSSQFKRVGGILRRGASDQITDYTRRFGSIKGIYNGFLKDLMRTHFRADDAVAVAKEFFGTNKVEFAAVDGTEYTKPLFDLVIFFGGSYTARGTIEFREKGPEIEYSTKLTEEGVGVSSCIPM